MYKKKGILYFRKHKCRIYFRRQMTFVKTKSYDVCFMNQEIIFTKIHNTD